MAGPYTTFNYGDPAVSPGGIGYTYTPPGPFVGGPQTYQKPFFGVSVPYLYAAVIRTGIVGTAYNEAISVQFGHGPYTFSVSSGALPPGLGLNSSTGIITGTPTTVGTYTFGVSVTDSIGAVGLQTFTINTIAMATGGGNYGYTA